MTAIAVISDIHGNIPALEAVRVDLGEQQVDEVLVGGDLVGRGPQGSEVVRRVRAAGWRGVKGNHEDYLLDFRCGRVPTEWLELDEWAAARFMADQLDPEDERFIGALPLTIQAETAPELCLVHGSPRSNNEGLGPWTADRELRAHLARVPGKVLVCGHTHRPLLRRFDEGTVVNVGAVGLPFNGDSRAQYAILREQSGEWDVELRQVEYDREALLAVYESSGFLARGGVTATLLRIELDRATPYLVPFIRWARARGLSVDVAHLDAFLEFYDPAEPLSSFLRRLEE